MKKILAVDDNDQNLYMIQVLLQSRNYQVLLATNGEEALKTARQDRPDLVISDILMPVMDGFTLIREWKKDDHLKTIPFIFYTATYIDPQDEEYALALGADKFIQKPMAPDLFLEEILSLAQGLKHPQKVREPVLKEDNGDYKLYSTRLVKKLEKKMVDLELEITKRDILEKKLRKARQEWKDIFDAIGNPVFIVDPEHRILQANLASVKATHASEQALIGKKCFEVFHHSTGPIPNCPMHQIFETKQPLREIEIEALGRSFLVSCTPIFHEDQTLEKVIHMATDITGTKVAEQSLRESEKKFRGIFENAHIGIVLANPKGEIQEFNEEFRKILGYDAQELKNMNFSEFTHPEDLEEEYLSFHQVLAGDLNTYRMQKRYITKARSISWIEITVSAIRTPKGDIQQFIGMVLDINKQKKSEAFQRELEAQLRQAQKMESIGNLAGGIAHDFNNILASILGYTELSLADVEQETRLKDHLEEIYSAGKRAKDLVTQILTFARKTDERTKPLRPDKIGQEVLKLLRSATPATIDIQSNFNSASHVMANPTQIHQVFMNLCTNAVQSMESSGGRLTVSSWDDTIEPGSLRALCFGPGNYMVLEVSDTGKGIPQENLHLIFDPYFTTKGPARGTGLGLSTVHGIVKSAGGEITVTSLEDQGTVFRIYLPLVEKPEKSAPVPDDPIPKGVERILFVDDEPAIAEVGTQILTRLGYALTQKRNSLDALETFRSTPYGFDLVVTDMTMPHMTGEKLAQELILIRPDIPVILLTGHQKKFSTDQLKKMGIRAFAHKPIMLRQLAKIVRTVLDDAGRIP